MLLETRRSDLGVCWQPKFVRRSQFLKSCSLRSVDFFEYFFTCSFIQAAGRADLLALHTAVVYVRQSAEWAVRDLKGSFARLKSVLPWDKDRRKTIFEAAILLSNFRTRRIGLSQVRTVYQDHLSFNILQFFGVEVEA